MAQPKNPERARRFQFAASRRRSSQMEVPRLSLDALSLARALLRAVGDSLAQIQARPRVETAVKSSGGVVAALLALKYAKSLRSACLVGLLAGVFAHSLYADVLRKKPPVRMLTAATEPSLHPSSHQVIETLPDDATPDDGVRQRRR